MKLTIKYEADEIKALIREDLVRQGIAAAADADIVFKKDHAVITVDAQRDGALDAAPVTPAPSLVQEKVAAVSPSPPPSPPLTVVDGGATPVDMTDILRTSSKLSKTESGLYPPAERTLMDGESYEHPHLKG